MKKIIPATLILFIVFIASCKKEDNTQNTEEIEAQYATLLTSKPWKYALTDKTPGTNPKTNITRYYAFSNCESDDVYKFNTNGISLIIEEGASSCDNSLKTKGVNYEVDFRKQEIVIDGQSYQIAELTATQLKFYSLGNGQGGLTSTIYVLEH